MWINYQFVVCPLVLKFLHKSSQKWLVFANFLVLLNFLPQLTNFFPTDISVISVTFCNSELKPHSPHSHATLFVAFGWPRTWQDTSPHPRLLSLLLIEPTRTCSYLISTQAAWRHSRSSSNYYVGYVAYHISTFKHHEKETWKGILPIYYNE